MRVQPNAKKRDTVTANKLLRTAAFPSAILLALLSLQTARPSDAAYPEAILAVPAKDNSLAAPYLCLC